MLNIKRLILVYDQVANLDFCYETRLNAITDDDDVSFNDAQQFCLDLEGALVPFTSRVDKVLFNF